MKSNLFPQFFGLSPAKQKTSRSPVQAKTKPKAKTPIRTRHKAKARHTTFAEMMGLAHAPQYPEGATFAEMMGLSRKTADLLQTVAGMTAAYRRSR